MPKVSVIILTKNRRNLLKKCLYSLINQTNKNFEIILLDEHSEDGTEEMVRKISEKYTNIKLIQRDKKGLGYGRNLGFLSSRGEVIAFIDDDEEAHPDWIKKGVEALDDLNVDIVRGAVYYPDGTLFRELRTDIMEFPTANIFYRKKVIEDVGMFDEQFIYCSEDVDLGMRAIEKGYKLVLYNEAITYHVHRTSQPIPRLKNLWKTGRFRAMNRVLRYKKHKKYFKKQLHWNVFYKKSHVTIIILFLSIVVSLINAISINKLFIYWASSSSFVISYFLFQVFVDRNIHKYPQRIIFSPYYLALGLIETVYTVKGAIKYKYFML